MNRSFMFRKINSVIGNMRPQGKNSASELILCRVEEHSDYPKAPFPMCFTRQALAALIDSVGIRPPESGAMGFSRIDRMGFDLVEFSASGSGNSGGAVYRPDHAWGFERTQFHLAQPSEAVRAWSGDLHSHPGSFGHPSSKAGRGLGDLGYVEEVFAMNEWMEWFFIPILTGTGSGDVVIHPWVCRRGRGAAVELMVADLQICDSSKFPLRECNPAWEQRIENEKKERERLEKEEAEKMKKEDIVEVSGEADAVQDTVPVGDYHFVEEVAQKHNLANADERQLAEYRKRLTGVVSPDFSSKTILVVGVGAGSYAVEKILRLCPRAIRICDFDTVEMPNLSRTSYTVRDALTKRRKVDALVLRAKEVNPWVSVRPYALDLTRMSAFQLNEMFEGVDLVVAGTDSLAAQALINIEAANRKIPAVFIGIHAGAQGGRVIWTMPDHTPCYRCIAKERFEAAERNEAAVNLNAATGSIFDCQFIDMIASKVAVAILERGQDSSMGRFFQHMGVRNDIVIRCDPDYEWGQALWNAVLDDLPKQPKDFAAELKKEVFLGMDSIWLQSSFDPDCPVCGKLHTR